MCLTSNGEQTLCETVGVNPLWNRSASGRQRASYVSTYLNTLGPIYGFKKYMWCFSGGALPRGPLPWTWSRLLRAGSAVGDEVL